MTIDHIMMREIGNFMIGLGVLILVSSIGYAILETNAPAENGFSLCKRFCAPMPARIETTRGLPHVVSCACYETGTQLEMEIK